MWSPGDVILSQGRQWRIISKKASGATEFWHVAPYAPGYGERKAASAIREADFLQRSIEYAQRHAAYTQYLSSPEWKAKRDVALIRAARKCEECGNTRRLQVHHLTYDRLGDEEHEDLRVLCDACHRREHKLDLAPLDPESLGIDEIPF